MVEAADRDIISSKRKAISAVFPYAMLLEQGGRRGMVDVILRTARNSYLKGFMWYPIRSYIATLLDDEIPPSLNLVVVLTSPHASWSNVLDGPKAVVRWATVPRLGWSMLDALLQISSVDSLRPHVPVDI